MRVRLKGIKKTSKQMADGSKKYFYYHRATGLRLPDNPNSSAFIRAVADLDAAAAREAKAKNDDTIWTLIRAYEASSDWTGLRESTRKIEAYNLAAVGKAFGHMKLAALDDIRVRSVFLGWRDDEAKKTPRAADSKMARLAKVFSFGVDRGLIKTNPLASFKRVYGVDRSDILWLPEHIAAFNKVAAPELQLALVVALHTGQRQGDLLALTWSAYDGKALQLQQSKTKAWVYIPCTKALKATLDDLKAAGRSSTHVLTRADGTPWTSDLFKQAWRAAYAASGLKDDLHFHDLRGTAVTMLAEAGCTVQETASITGHSLASADKILKVYLSRTRALAESAIAKLETRLAR